MSLIDLSDEIIFKVKIGTEVIELREPTVQDMENHEDNLNSGGFGGLKCFLVDIGMPEDKMNSLGITKVTKLVKGIVGGLDEKK